MIQHRNNVVQEILQTEKSFVSQLDTLIQVRVHCAMEYMC
mgnify:CR=1 FL=1